MLTRTWNILMILLIGPFAFFVWKTPRPHQADAAGQS